MYRTSLVERRALPYLFVWMALFAITPLATLAQTLSFTQVPAGYTAGSIDLPAEFAGVIQVDPTNPDVVYVSVGAFNNQSIIRLDLTTHASTVVATGPFGSIGGIGVISPTQLVITDNDSAAGGPADETILLAVDNNPADGDFDDPGEITELIAPILTSEWTGGVTAIAPAGNPLAIPTGSVVIQTSDGNGDGELLVIEDPLGTPAYRPAGAAFFAGTDFGGGFVFDSNGHMYVGSLDSTAFTGLVHGLNNLNGDDDIDAGEAEVVLSGEAGMNGMAIAEDDQIFFVAGASIRDFTAPVNPIGASVAASDFAMTDAGFLGAVLVNTTQRSFAPSSGSGGATLLVSGFTGGFAAATNILTLTPKSLDPIAPIIGDIGIVFVSDREGSTKSATAANVFVFPDALDLTCLALDGDTPKDQIKWSLYEPTGTYNINGVPSIDINTDDPVDPPANRRIDNQDLDCDSGDSTPLTITFRNQLRSPLPGGPVYPPFSGSDEVPLTLFASDCTTYSSRTITVLSDSLPHFSPGDGIFDGGFLPSAYRDFATDGPGAWVGLDSDDGLIGSGEATAGASGLCMTVPAAGDNQVEWVSPTGYVALHDMNVYRIRSWTSTTQTDMDAIPFLNVIYDNFNGVGNPGGIYSGEYPILDVGGGANGIGRAEGRTIFDVYAAPNAMMLPQWRGDIDPANSPFSPAFEPFNDMRLRYRINDIGSGMINADADSGTVCISKVYVEKVRYADLGPVSTLYDPRITFARHFAESLSQVGIGGTATINDNTNAATYNLDETSFKTFGPFDKNAVSNGVNFNIELYPIIWKNDELLASRSAISNTATIPTGPPPAYDPVDVICNVFNTATNELGFDTTTIRGSAGNMQFAASPRSPQDVGGDPQEYIGFFATNNKTIVLPQVIPDADRLRPLMNFFNTPGIGADGAGSDTFTVESLVVDRLNIPADLN